MASPMNAVGKALFTKLTGASSLTSLLSAGTAGVFENVAQQNEDVPYVVFNAQSPSTPLYAFGNAATVKIEDIIYQVKGITEGHSTAAGGTIADKINDALNGATLTVSGYTCFQVSRLQDIDYPEVVQGGKRFNHRGALYRVRAYSP